MTDARRERLREEAESPFICVLLIGLVVAGIGLRVWQFLANTSIFLDEVGVARNVFDRSAWDLLTKPLAYDQVAPKGFLLAEKVAVLLFGPYDYALRLFPLACSIAALILFSRVTRFLLDGSGRVVALALFAAAAPFITFASEAKQYSSDVAAAVALLLLALDLRAPRASLVRAVWVGLAGAVLVWFSQPAVLMALGLSVPLFLLVLKNTVERPLNLRAFIIAPGLWMLSGLAATAVSVLSMTPSTRAYMQMTWDAGFPPYPVTQAFHTLWPWDRVLGLIGTGDPASLAYPAPALYAAGALVGVAVIWARARALALLLIMPVAVTLGAAFRRLYPFSDRLILFLVPILLVGIGSTAAQLNRWLARRSRAAGVAMLLLVASPGIYPVVKTPPAYREEDMKSVLAYLRTKRVPGDDLYVYYAAAPAVTFYGSMSRLTDEEYAVGGCHRGNTREYFEELDTFRGHPRVWVLMTHSVYNEREDMLRYLDSIGVRRDRFAVPSRLVGRSGSLAEAFLYDLSDSSRLSRATAASSPVTGPPPYPDVTCANGPQIMIPPRGFPLQRTR